MLTVETYIAPSSIHGIGLFAKHAISEGTVIWKFDPLTDILYTKEQVSNLPPILRELFRMYSWVSSSGLYVMSVDLDKHTNHSDTPNMICGQDELSPCYAARDIEAGEELTSDYREFEATISADSEQQWWVGRK
jgi:SET domain-containing protein